MAGPQTRLSVLALTLIPFAFLVTLALVCFPDANSFPDELSRRLLIQGNVSHDASLREENNTHKRPAAILCFFTGDEGSTVLSEALKLHPQVYSPDWLSEPANKKRWPQDEFTLQKQIDGIRFLLGLSSNTAILDIGGLPQPLSPNMYKEMVGDVDALYIKVNVCRKEHNRKEKYGPCVTEVLDNLLCGHGSLDGDTLDHIILPMRYGFDRVCSTYVHHLKDKTLYERFSQFNYGAEDNTSINVTLQALDKEAVIDLREKQQLYVKNYMQFLRLARNICPNKKGKAQIHVYDYDNAKATGMEETLAHLFGDLGLENSPKTIDLGRYSRRKPSNYCRDLFDARSRKLIQQQEAVYNKWLQRKCLTKSRYPWCRDEAAVPIE